MTREWKVPPELVPYDQYTNYPGRAEELVNHKATMFNNAVVALMRAETHAQYALLTRLRKEGLLAPVMPPGSDFREAIRRTLARADGFDYDTLDEGDYQVQADLLIAMLLVRDTQENYGNG